MNSVLAVYDIPQSLKLKNPSATLRKYGFRVNLSCWIFPGNNVPVSTLEELRDDGATVHIIPFEGQAQEKILQLAQDALQKHAYHVVEHVEKRCGKLKAILNDPAGHTVEEHPFNGDGEEKFYKKWRSTLSRAKRELLAAQQCAFGFGISREVGDALTGLQNVLKAELDLALAYRGREKAPAEAVA